MVIVSAAIFIVLVNGFFVIAEFALVKVRRTRLEELLQQGNRRAQLVLRITSSFDAYLGATQLGITLSSLALGWLGEPLVAALLQPQLSQLVPGVDWLVRVVSIVLGFAGLTFFHIVLGELVPKSMAMQKAESLALLVAGPLHLFYQVCYPFIMLFQRTAQGILKLMGLKPASQSDLAHSEDELRMIVSASHRGGVLNQMESELIDNVFDFADRLAREVMVPRQDMVCLFLEDPLTETMQIVRQTGHTRYPLCSEDKDHVIGMIHVRDLMDLDICSREPQDLRTVMRDILIVPEGMSVAKLLQFMRRKRTHLAVVVDEYGGTAGLVALEDVIEEIVGDIQDEHDTEGDGEVRRFPDGSYEFDGRVLLDDITELLNIRLEEPDEDTIGGYIFGILGRRPEVGDNVHIGGYRFTVLRVNGFRVVRVKAVPLEPLTAADPE